MPIGSSQILNKLARVIEERTAGHNLEISITATSEEDNSGMIELMQILSWCFASASNQGEMFWLEQIKGEEWVPTE